MFFKGENSEFNIKESWSQKSDKPTSDTTLNSTNARRTSKNSEKDLNSILNKAGKSAVTNNSPSDPGKNKEILQLIDSDLSKKIMKNLINENVSKKLPNENVITPNNKRNLLPKGDSDLVGSMASRLSKLELTCNNQREEIKEKMRIINELNEEISLFKINVSKDQSDSEVRNLKEENKKLNKRIQEMESFLKSYGLKWVGDLKEGEFRVDDITQELNCNKPIYKNNLPREIDMIVITRRIEELNILMEKDGSHQVFKDRDGAYKIKKMDPVPIAFYKNGIAIRSYPFFPYSSKEAQEILEDILDGYFPLLMKKKFPDGVFLKLMDKLDDNFKNSSIKNSKYGDLVSLDEESLKPLSKEEFLKQIPKTVIKNGQVFNVRDELEKKIDGNIDLKHNEGTFEIESELIKKNKAENNENQITFLKIRSEHAKKTLVVKLMSCENIKTVYELILNYSENNGNFELISTYDKKILSKDCDLSLEELGLHPSSALQMNPIKK